MSLALHRWTISPSIPCYYPDALIDGYTPATTRRTLGEHRAVGYPRRDVRREEADGYRHPHKNVNETLAVWILPPIMAWSDVDAPTVPTPLRPQSSTHHHHHSAPFSGVCFPSKQDLPHTLQLGLKHHVRTCRPPEPHAPLPPPIVVAAVTRCLP
ncbi:hypothetical protein BDN71DRAFT_1456364 [Pleurotus eryngii]|uniref:Uncharacterized protein n=1 Tax=Pleurotus eryngii TaxID=5323 RepID=A0A9P5ZKP4_PLEER|nr:hypothetical protein BDN71DRAFT_1456364 [Pleurotus eryngii]